MKRLSTRNNIIAVFLVTAACVGYFVWATQRNLQQTEIESRNVKSALQVLLLLEAVLNDMQDLESGQRGYLIAGKPAFLKPYNKALTNISKDTAALTATELYDSTNKAELNQLLLLIRKKIIHGELALKIHDTKGYDSAAVFVQKETGRLIMDSIRDLIFLLETNDRVLLNQSNINRERIAKNTSREFFMLAVIFFCILLICFLAINRNIKSRQKAEKELKYNASLVEESGDAIMSADTAFNILSWNKGAEKMYGITEAEALGKKYHILLKSKRSDDDRKNTIEQLKTTGFVIEEVEYEDKNGKPVTVQASCSLLLNEKHEPAACIVVHRDISERKRLENQLKKFNEELEQRVKDQTAAIRESEEKYRSFIEQASDGIIIYSFDGTIHEFNTSAHQSAGYSRQEFAQLKLPDLLFEKKIVLDQRIYENILAGNAVLFYRTLLKKDGTPVEIELNAKLLSDGKVLAFVRDITVRKKAEQALKTSEESKRLIISSALDAIVCMNTSGIVTVWNPQAEKIFGWKENEIIGRRMSETIVPEQHRPAHEKGMKNYMQSGEGKILNKLIEITALSKDGREFPVELFITPIEQDGVKYFCAFIRDITQRKIAEEALQKSELRYRSLIEQASDAIMITDQQGNFVDVNSAFCKQLGYSKEEILLLNASQVIDPEQLKNKPIRFDLINAGESVLNERRMIHKDGTIVEVEANVKLLPDGRILAIARDIRERKIVENELRQSREKFISLVNTIDGIVWEADARNFNFSFVSDQAERLLGYPVDTWLTEETFWANHIHPDDREFAVSYCIECTRKKIPHEFEYRMIAADGKIVWLQDIVVVITENDEPVKLRGLMVDITERKMAQENLQQSYKEIRELASNLQNIREEERAMMAREIHDELGQQLTGFKMDMFWLRRRLKNGEEEIKLKIENTTHLIDDAIKTVRRIATALRPSILDDLGLVPALEWQSEEFEKRSGIKVQFTGTLNTLNLIPPVAIALFRIYQELLTNVARHSAASFVESSLYIDNEQLFLVVSDNGRGFDVNNTSHKKTLGLLGMKERTLLMGGLYEIKSKPGEGTTVVVSVPLVNSVANV